MKYKINYDKVKIMSQSVHDFDFPWGLAPKFLKRKKEF